MELKIFNYSFHPVPEDIKKMGVVELSDKVNQILKSLFDFDLMPTRQEIKERCRGIVHHAVQLNHKAVFLRNYESYQSELIYEFHENNIRVFVPVYSDNRYTERIVRNGTINQICYLNIINIIEVPNRNQIELIESTVNLTKNGSSYQLLIEGKLKTGLQVRFNLAEGDLSDIITWFQAFSKQIKSFKIQDYVASNMGIQYGNINDFTQNLISVLYEIKDQNIGTDKITEIIKIIKIIKTASIIDSNDVQEYVALTNYATISSTRNVRDKIKLLNKAWNLYDSFDAEYKDVITSFDTNSFRRLGLRRHLSLKFNPAYLYRYLGFLNMQSNLWVNTEENFRYSVDLYEEYLNDEISDLELDSPTNNLILTRIFLSKNKSARSLIKQRLNKIGSNDITRILPLKMYLSRTYRNTREYDIALEINREIQKMIDKERNLDDYYEIDIQNAIIYYLNGRIKKALDLLNELLNIEGVSKLVKSYACYLSSLILYSDKKIIKNDILEKLSIYYIYNRTEAYFCFINILTMIENNEAEPLIISKLNEFIYLYPGKTILGFIQLGIIYSTTNNWIALSELIETIIPISTQHSSIMMIKLYLCKYYLGIILGNQDLSFKNIIEKSAVEENIDITNYYFGNEVECAINEIKKILDMDLVKVEDYIFD